MIDEEVIIEHKKILNDIESGKTDYDDVAVMLSLHATRKVRENLLKKEKREEAIKEILTDFPILRREGMVSSGQMRTVGYGL